MKRTNPVADPRILSAFLWLSLGVVMVVVAAANEEAEEEVTEVVVADDLLSRKMVGLDRTAIHSF